MRLGDLGGFVTGLIFRTYLHQSWIVNAGSRAQSGPATTRFLHLLQPADPGAAANPTTLVNSINGTAFTGAIVANTAVLFPMDLYAHSSGKKYVLPAPVGMQLIIGLTPNAG